MTQPSDRPLSPIVRRRLEGLLEQFRRAERAGAFGEPQGRPLSPAVERAIARLDECCRQLFGASWREL
jgi:hypothetical protein